MFLEVVLFFLLSPGVLFTLDQTPIPAVFIHVAIFIGLLYILNTVFEVRIEGFKDKHVEGWQLGNSCGTDYCMAPKYYCLENDKGDKYCSETE
jgi:hypothetical protein